MRQALSALIQRLQPNDAPIPFCTAPAQPAMAPTAVMWSRSAWLGMAWGSQRSDSRTCSAYARRGTRGREHSSCHRAAIHVLVKNCYDRRAFEKGMRHLCHLIHPLATLPGSRMSCMYARYAWPGTCAWQTERGSRHANPSGKKALWQRGSEAWVGSVGAHLGARQRKGFEVSVLHVCEVAATQEQGANGIAFVAYGSACACRRMGLALRADDAHGSQQSSRAHTCKERSNHSGWQKEQETAMRTACSS